MIRDAFRAIAPPFLVNLYRRSHQRYGWFGDYESWADAVRHSTGYNSREIAEKVLRSALKVKNGEVAYERDSVVFDRIQYSWPVLAGLLWAAIRNKGVLKVMDIGGGYGSSYFQNARFLSVISGMKWNIVEQPDFVVLGKAHFENDTLKFYDDPNVCLREGQPNVALLSCVLPYLPDPYAFLSSINGYRVPTLIFDRMPFMPKPQKHRISVHRVNPAIYDASIPTHLFNEDEFLHAVLGTYTLVEEFDSDLGFVLNDGTRIPNKGYIFQLKP
jgi:putative methyltransferase (TIGR04325 family)